MDAKTNNPKRAFENIRNMAQKRGTLVESHVFEGFEVLYLLQGGRLVQVKLGGGNLHIESSEKTVMRGI